MNNKPTYKVNYVPFSALTAADLYGIMKIRQEVFIVEQNCPYLDADGKDFEAYHLTLKDENEQILAYTRLLPEGLAYPNYTSIGRVLSHPSTRGTGIGIDLLVHSIAAVEALWGTKFPIKIGAQSYLLRFYEKFGFVSTGEEYIEDDIPHTKMIKH